ncbi:MAG: tetratricopeptide repeat protein [Candidatus Binatia bacterium]
MRREAVVNQSSLSCLLPFALCLIGFVLPACESELIRKQEEQIGRQQEEILRQRKEIEELTLARRREEQKRRDCNRAFRDFEKAQALKDPHEAVALYRQGLKLCPDDDVAHYELGKILHGIGRIQEAKGEFQEALRINPNFLDAKRQLETIQGNR